MKEPFASINQISNRSLRERILDVLRDAIISGELKPGQTLVESDLATHLGVSRAPLREALQILNTEGLLETIPYHGTTVRQLTRTDIEELYSLRIVLETFAIRRIIAQNDPAQVADLRAIYEEMLVAAQAGDIKRVNVIDRQFHDRLIELSNHSMLLSIWNTVAMRVRQVMALTNMRNEDIKQIAFNHIPLLEALEAGDEAKATAIIEKHVASAGDLIAEGWGDEAEENSQQ